MSSVENDASSETVDFAKTGEAEAPSIARPTISVNREATESEPNETQEDNDTEVPDDLSAETRSQPHSDTPPASVENQDVEDVELSDQDDLPQHLQAMENDKDRAAFIFEEESKTESKATPSDGAFLPDQVVHFDNVIAEITNADDIVQHIRKMMFTRVSWVRYEEERKRLVKSENPEDSTERTSAQEMLDKREARDPTLISLEGVGGEEKFYDEHAYGAILEWRRLQKHHDDMMDEAEFDHSSSEYLLCCDQILAVEIYLIQEHGLTIPDNKDATRKVAWDGLERKEQIIWRLEDRKSIFEEYDKARKREKAEATTRMLKSVFSSPGRLFSRSEK